MTLRALLKLLQRDDVRDALLKSPATAELVSRYIAGYDVTTAIETARRQNGHGLLGLLALVGPEHPSMEQVARHTEMARELARSLAGLPDNEISVLPALFGMRSGLSSARPQLRAVVETAAAGGVRVTIDMGAYEMVDDTLKLFRELRKDHPDLGIAVQSMLRRTYGDVRELAAEGARVRLCAGAYPAPLGTTYRKGQEADVSFVRCLRVLMESTAYPMVATHDKRLIPIAQELAERTGRTADEFEFQMLYEFRPIEQRRLADTGNRCRVYLPFGPEWYDYVSLRFAANPVRWVRSFWRKR